MKTTKKEDKNENDKEEVSNMCGRGEFEGYEGRIRPFLDDTLECVSESIMIQKRAMLAQAAN